MKKESIEFSILCWLDRLESGIILLISYYRRKSPRSEYKDACICCAVVACMSPYHTSSFLCSAEYHRGLPTLLFLVTPAFWLLAGWAHGRLWWKTRGGRKEATGISPSLSGNPSGSGWVLSLVPAPRRQVHSVSRVLWVPHALALVMLLLPTPSPPARGSSGLLLLRIS